MDKMFSDDAWSDYLYWQKNDKRYMLQINKLIKSIEREGASNGIGKPEALKHDLSGYYSRRISKYNRLIYKVDNDMLIISSCKDHYD